MEQNKIQELADELWFDLADETDGWQTTMNYKSFIKAINKTLTQISEATERIIKLPNDEIDLKLLGMLLEYSDRYEINIQFWPKQTTVYIAKNDVDFEDYGGDFDFAIRSSIEYLDRINRADSKTK